MRPVSGNGTFSPELVQQIEALWERYPHKKAALLPALHLIQKERAGWLSEETIRAAAELFDVPDMHITGIVGFYDMFHEQPVGRAKLRDLFQYFSVTKRPIFVSVLNDIFG